MKIVVCVKQIPDPQDPNDLDAETGRLLRSGKLILDDSDIYGVEMALQLAGGDTDAVTVVSMAPNDETSGIRMALAMGAADAILVSDPTLAGTDALGTAKVLAAAIKRCGADLVLAATESSDGYTGTVAAQIAELLDLPSVTFAKQIAIDGRDLSVHRQTEAGFDEVICPLPAVVTVTAGVVEPRYPSMRGIMSARNKPIDVVRIADLDIDVNAIGEAGARQQIISIEDAPSRTAGTVVVDSGEAHLEIIELLERLKAI